jgi:hypothetical protein
LANVIFAIIDVRPDHHVASYAVVHDPEGGNVDIYCGGNDLDAYHASLRERGLLPPPAQNGSIVKILQLEVEQKLTSETLSDLELLVWEAATFGRENGSDPHQWELPHSSDGTW